MNQDLIFRELHEVGCCYGCCARFLGLRNPASYADLQLLASKYLEKSGGESSDATERPPGDAECVSVSNGSKTDAVNSNGSKTDTVNCNGTTSNGQGHPEDEEGPAAKRRRLAVCVCCLGVLQPETWPEAVEQVAESMRRRGYESDAFACALSSPMCIALRERSLQLHLQGKLPDVQLGNITPLKEAWKHSFGPALAAAIGKKLDSGSVCPLLITVNMDYDKDQEESRCTNGNAPERSVTRRRLADVLSAGALHSLGDFPVPPPHVAAPARPLSVRITHAPIYIAGRYIKLSRKLSQTPWLVDGEKMMESSVQDIIFQPIAQIFGIKPSDCESRLKLVAAGREDVDVRCLGAGRPFAVEVADPHRLPDAAQLATACEHISASRDLLVHMLRIVGREEMTLLKKGEQFKEKTYRALCVKLAAGAENPEKISEMTSEVTEEDLKLIADYSEGDDSCKVKIQQKTPIRVLHRRPLLTRERKILDMRASKVPGQPSMLTLDLRTDAGTYVKEFVHGDFGRTKPSLRDIMRCDIDIVALDVTQVHLEW